VVPPGGQDTIFHAASNKKMLKRLYKVPQEHFVENHILSYNNLDSHINAILLCAETKFPSSNIANYE